MESFLFKMQSGEIVEGTYSYTAGGSMGWIFRFYGTPTRAEIMFSAADWLTVTDEIEDMRMDLDGSETCNSRALRQEMEELV